MTYSKILPLWRWCSTPRHVLTRHWTDTRFQSTEPERCPGKHTHDAPSAPPPRYYHDYQTNMSKRPKPQVLCSAMAPAMPFSAMRRFSSSYSPRSALP